MNFADYLRSLIKGLFEPLIKNEDIRALIAAIIMVLFWIFLAYIVTFLVKKMIFKTEAFRRRHELRETKEQVTVSRLINNLIRAVFIFWITIMVLNELGVDLVPLIAGAGILAFAVGFGAQELIKDLISGVFLIAEKTIKIGDYIETEKVKGTVTDIGLRRTRLETWKGEVITINNGDIRTVINSSINPSFAVIEFNLSQDFDIRNLDSDLFKNFLTEFKENTEFVLEMPESALIISLDKNIRVTVNIKTATRKHVSVERAFRKALVLFFNENDWKLDMTIKIEEISNE